MPRLSTKVCVLCIALTALSALATWARPIVVIVHPDTNVTSIDRSELSKLFLKRLRTWADGSKVEAVDQLPESPARAEFSRRVHKRSVVTIEVYWKRMIHSGRAVPPPELAGDEEVLEFVRTHPGAIGYVNQSTALKGVRQVRLED